MPSIPGIPEDLVKTPGVEVRSPPVEYIDSTRTVIRDALRELGDNRGVLTWVLTDKGVNLAIVDKINEHVAVSAWIGKSWGAPISAGIVGQATW